MNRSAMKSKLALLVSAAALVLLSTAAPVAAAPGGSPGPCESGTLLEGQRLGHDVSYVARNLGTPLPEVFAFDDPGAPPPMPPGQLLQFAREHGLC